MGQYTIKNIQDQAELLKTNVQSIYRSLYTKLGLFPKSLDQVPYYIITKLYPSPTKEPLTITPSTTEQQFSSNDSSKYDPITVEPVTSAIDGNIIPENIKEGVSILGVVGTLSDGGPGGSDKFIVPSDMSFGYSQFTVIPSYLDFSSMKSMNYTFKDCTGLTTIPLLNISNVIEMSYTFSGCRSLTTIPLLDTSNVQNMSGIFENCTGLTTIPQLVTTNVTDMSYMFQYCMNLTTIPLLDTSNVQNMINMFDNCRSLTTIPQLVTTNVTDMNSMFSNCFKLTEIPLLDTSNVTDMSYMFYACVELTSIPQLVTTNVYIMDHMFEGCSSLTTIPQLDMSNVQNMYYMFFGCSALTTIPSLNTSNVSDMNGVFADCNALTTVEGIDFSGLRSELTHLFGDTSDKSNLTKFIVNGKINVSISDSYSIKALTAIDYDSVKSILTAAANTDYDFVRTLAFNRTMTDQNGELAALVASCTSKGWTITGLTIN